jgi:hypothetical protein
MNAALERATEGQKILESGADPETFAIDTTVAADKTYTVSIGDAFAGDSPRARATKAKEWLGRALGAYKTDDQIAKLTRQILRDLATAILAGLPADGEP